MTDFVSVISQTPCVSMETWCTLAKTFKIWEQIVHQHGYILIIHFICVGISCIIAILPSGVCFNVTAWQWCGQHRGAKQLLNYTTTRHFKYLTSSLKVCPFFIIVCACAGSSQCVESLLCHGADPDYEVSHLGSPLYMSCLHQHTACSKILLHKGNATFCHYNL